ncbi:hypothetical protein [Paramagnetospirillum kuznetsovii]|uniref:hypothetical protein n=1 Tax=Paramagnetospirillum kuznetsovii TaxID=2053833 RepID=UPI0018644A2B|nr:hypothetical protein [Paramagnetospirillum kuznetsovii]
MALVLVVEDRRSCRGCVGTIARHGDLGHLEDGVAGVGDYPTLIWWPTSRL